MRSKQKLVVAAGAGLLLAGGCSLDTLQLPQLGAPDPLGGDMVVTTVNGVTPVEAYQRVARGALKCWFGANGSLKKTHAFHGKAEPAAAGGGAEIIVHTRDADNPGHGALMAYRIEFKPVLSGSMVEARNLRFPKPVGGSMTSDVKKWLAGEEGCSVVGVGGWDAGAQSPGAAQESDNKGGKKKGASR